MSSIGPTRNLGVFVSRARFLASLGMTRFAAFHGRMMMGMMLFGMASVLTAAAAPAKDKSATRTIELPADHVSAKLRPGPGSDVTEDSCGTCHSTDYLVRQPGADAKRWLEVVNKMVKMYGATVGDEDAKIIADYLAGAYPSPPSKPLPRSKPETSNRNLRTTPQTGKPSPAVAPK